jgi:outer membrane protein OmpA-like peptidoglycan-associated protein
MMNWKKAAVCGAFAVSLLLIGGCGIFDTGSDKKPKMGENVGSPLPGPPTNLNVTTTTGEEPEVYGAGADENSLGHPAFSDLKVVLGPNFPIVYFGYDRSTITSEERPKLDKVAAYLQKYPQLYLIIEGHCDERGTLEYNRALGERRAIGVKKYIESQGISGERIRTISYGEEKPAVPNEHAKNRRAVLLPAEKM